MIDDPHQRGALLDAKVEQWTAEAKKLLDSGKEAAALLLYRRAADELPGAPWLQHRTAELARKLKQNEVAIGYFRRAATSFEIANFAKRAVAPLRTAWSLAEAGLPSTSALLVELGIEMIQLYKRLGFAADASVILERTNGALRERGFSELPFSALDSAVAPISRPPSSETILRRSADEEPPAGSGSVPKQPASDPRASELAKLPRRR